MTIRQNVLTRLYAIFVVLCAFCLPPVVHALGTAPQEVANDQIVLRFAGEIADNTIRLMPVQAARGLLPDADRGPYTLRLTLSNGQLIERHFDEQIALGRVTRSVHFAVQVANPGELAAVAIEKAGKPMKLRLAEPSNPSANPATYQLTARPTTHPNLLWRETDNQLQLSWLAAAYPWLQVTHVDGKGARLVLTLAASGGTARLPLAGIGNGGEWEVSLSNGLNTRLLVLPRTPKE